MHLDYFKNPIEVGDIVLRIQNGFTYTTKILALRKSQVGIQRNWHYTGTDKIKNTPLWISGNVINYQIINLSKLDNSKIQETIKSFINEI